jgi:hypothetical protein
VNRPGCRVVEAHRARRPLGAVLLAIVCAGSIPSCTEVTGGAVELSWLLRPSNGDENACSEQSCCATAHVVDMRLMWDVGGVMGSDFWPCEDNRAVTGFELPPGEATLWVVPECATGPAEADAYEAPAPVVRTLVDGEVASLNAVVVQVQLANCDSQACICPQQ